MAATRHLIKDGADGVSYIAPGNVGMLRLASGAVILHGGLIIYGAGTPDRAHSRSVSRI